MRDQIYLSSQRSEQQSGKRSAHSPAVLTLILGMLLIALTSTGCVGVTAGSGTKAADATTATGPTITTEPISQSAVSGKTATFSVMATGTLPMMYQWNKNGAAIVGATLASYTTPTVATADNNSQFTVTVTDGTGTTTSAAAVLTVTAAAVAPTITAQPSNQTMPTGKPATFAVGATGTTPMSYQWSKNGAPISGATAQTYTTPSLAMTDSGAKFSVTVNNTAGSVVSAAAMVTVNAATVAPAFTSQPANQTATAGQTATFSVVVTGTAPISYQWSKNGVPIGGANSASYITPATAPSDSGATFSVVANNAAGSIVSNAAALTVNTANVAPSISMQPASKTVTTGQTAMFSVSAIGTPTPTYQWRKNGTAIGGATSASYTTPATAVSDSASQFSVVVTNSVSSVTSGTATLTVTAASVAPSITSQPARVSVTAGQTATFSVAAGGTSPFTYQWRKNGTAIGGASSASYTTPATAVSDSASQFSVVVTNSVNSVTSGAATLTVTAASVEPSITSQPASVTVNAGQTASFSVTAGGTAPFTYQWRKNGTAIGGATSASYTTPATAVSDSASQFSVVVTNSVSNVTSNAATLTVNATPGALTPGATTLAFGNVNIGSSPTSIVMFTNSGTASITISSVSIAGAGFGASGIPTGTILAGGQSATLTVTFAPSGAGAISGSVTVNSNASNPAAKVNLTGTGVQVAASHSVTLSWQASPSSGVTGYNVYRATSSGAYITPINSSPITGSQFTDSTVQSGQTFYYVVTSIDAGMESVHSNEVTAVIP